MQIALNFLQSKYFSRPFTWATRATSKKMEVQGPSTYICMRVNAWDIVEYEKSIQANVGHKGNRATAGTDRGLDEQ